MCVHSLQRHSCRNGSNSYLLKIDVLPLNPLFIRCFDPFQIHYFEVESISSCKLDISDKLWKDLVVPDILAYRPSPRSYVSHQTSNQLSTRLPFAVPDSRALSNANWLYVFQSSTLFSLSTPVQHRITLANGFAVAAKFKSISFIVQRTPRGLFSIMCYRIEKRLPSVGARVKLGWLLFAMMA
jgi:hypothetical protein